MRRTGTKRRKIRRGARRRLGPVRLCMAAVLLAVLFPLTAGAVQEENPDNREDEEPIASVEDAGGELLETFPFDEVDDALEELFPEERLDFQETVSRMIKGDIDSVSGLFRRLIRDRLTYAFRVGKDQLAHVLLIAVIAAVFRNFSRVFQSRQLSQISFYAVYLLMMALTLKTFAAVVEWTEEGVHMLTAFMGAFCPLYFVAVAAAKGSVTAVAFYQLVLFLIYLTELLIANVLLPMIHIYMIVRVLNDLSRENYLTKFAELIETGVSWSLKALLAVVAGFNVVQGMISPAIDSVKRSILARGAEAIPGVGDALGGMAEVAAGTAVLVKNGIGMAGALLCVALCLVPLVQMACITFLYKLAAAVIQPVSDERITGCVDTVGEGCRLLMRVLFTTGVLFLLTVAVAAAVTNGT